DPAPVLHPGKVQGQEIRRDDLLAHVGELFLRELLARDGYAELDALPGVVDGRLETRLGRADRAPGDAEAGLRQAPERTLQPPHVGESVLLRNAAFVEDDLPRLARPEAHLAVDPRSLEPLHA